MTFRGRLEYESLRDECSFWFSTVEEVGAFQGGEKTWGNYLRIGPGISSEKSLGKRDELKKLHRKTMETQLGFKIYICYYAINFWGLVSFMFLFYHGTCFNIQCRSMYGFLKLLAQSLVESQINL